MNHLRHSVLLLAPFAASALAGEAPAELDPVTVTAGREQAATLESLFSITRLDAAIDLIGAAHPNELFARVPGTWISRGSGQEHLTAIRSPVLTGAGACGAFLFLEDGIPVRPVGFCNVNQLFEINTEQADAIEVLRGPGSVLYGSNALHGAINVLHALPSHSGAQASASVGEYGFRRLALDAAGIDSGRGFRVQAFSETADSIQRDAGHAEQKMNVAWYGDNWRAHVAASSLNQDTAGYIQGEDAYRDPAFGRQNLDPDAYRRADSARTWAVGELALGGWRIELRPFARWSEMDFLQHFLPGMPLEENGQTSAGVLASLARTSGKAHWLLGMDLEWADGWLRETQDEPAEGSDFLRETRPIGRHYDYAVTQTAVSPWANLEYTLSERTDLVAGLRADWLRYDYDNRMDAGNRREDGSVCGFGGCIYNRPADRSDTFSTLSPKLGLRHRFDKLVWYVNLARGFRVPQATELYRLQRGQDVADLDPVELDSLESGLRGMKGAFRYDVALFVMRKRNDIFRDAEGFNVSSAKTRHRGLEFDLGWRADPRWLFALRGSWAEHEYAFDYRPADGEQFVDGREVDTAPRLLGSAVAQWTPSPGSRLELEYTYLGAYWLDAENTARYPGHDLVHLRWAQTFGKVDLAVRVLNLLDESYAERADYAFGDYRYFPGWPRRVNLTLGYTF